MLPHSDIYRPGDRLCDSALLRDGESGIRFHVLHAGKAEPAFIIRFRGKAHAYLNRCAHKQVELDWLDNQFFDAEQRYLICATHGARYEPASGVCVVGPCIGARLTEIAVLERDGAVWLAGDATSMLLNSP